MCLKVIWKIPTEGTELYKMDISKTIRNKNYLLSNAIETPIIQEVKCS